MKRIAVGQIYQESNGLNPVPTTRAEFEAFGLATGVDVMGRYGGVSELAGFSRLPEVLGEPVEWEGLIRAYAWSGGPMEDRLLDYLLDKTLRPLQRSVGWAAPTMSLSKAVGTAHPTRAGKVAGETHPTRGDLRSEPLKDGPVDGVLLSLHGAQCAESEPDAAGRVLAEIRRAIGPRVPLVATLDLHANLTPRMVKSADVLVGFHTHPHVDHAQTGLRAARALVQLLRTGQRPRVSAWKIPMVTNDDGRSTDRGVLAGLWREIVAAEKLPGTLSVGLYQVQPWIDVPMLGWAFYQACFGDIPPMDAKAVARACWETRAYAEQRFLRPEEVVPSALSLPGRPVVVSESHDATNSGAPGDSTHLLAELVRQRIPDGGALTFCVDPGSVRQCFEAGKGASAELNVGGKRDDRYCRLLPMRAKVVRLGELEYVLRGHGGHNLPVDMGRAAVIVAGDATVVLTEKTGPGSSPMLYEAMGLNPRKVKVVVAKSPGGFRRDYEPFAAGILYCAAPGCATPFLREVGYQRVSRPVYPLDNVTDMAMANWAGEMKRDAGCVPFPDMKEIP